MKHLLLLLSVLSFSSCGIVGRIKTVGLINGTQIEQGHFFEEMSFKEENGKIILPVEIQNKVYDFLFDTGAIAVIDNEVLQNLKTQKVTSQKVKDYVGTKSKLNYHKLEQISLQNINFRSAGIVGADFGILKTKGCSAVAGIIGANWMKKAKWQIDFQQQKLRFASSMDSLQIPENSDTIRFIPNLQGTPAFKFSTSNGVQKDMILDTGSAGNLSMPAKGFSKEERNAALLKLFGLTYGIFGSSLDSSFFIQFPSASVGNKLELSNPIVVLESSTSKGVMGTAFLRNYLLTIDWQRQYLIFSPVAAPEIKKVNNYGFGINLVDDKLMVSSVYKNALDQEKGLEYNDQILMINQRDLRQATQSDYCDLRLNGKNGQDNEAFIWVKVLRNGVQLDFKVKRFDVAEFFNKNE